MSALNALRSLLQTSCLGCNIWVFNELSGTDQPSYFKYLSMQPRFWDGTRSYAPSYAAFCPSGFFNQLVCNFGKEAVHDYVQRTASDAASQTPSDKGKGMQVFFNPPEGICNVHSLPNPSSGDQGVLNQATLFHEALHGYTGKFDFTLLSAFGFSTNDPSVTITYYLEGKVIPGGAQGALQCGN